MSITSSLPRNLRAGSESHWIFDIQVGWGYANATSKRIIGPDIAEAWTLRTRLGDEDWWLFGHELGHQFQTSDWTGGDVTEVCVNLFTMYTLNDSSSMEVGLRPKGSILIPSIMQRSNHFGMTADFFGKLQLYRQLVFEFGWDVSKRSLPATMPLTIPEMPTGASWMALPSASAPSLSATWRAF